MLVIACFAPRFMHWSWIDLDSSEHHAPEFNRAIDTLRQLEHPFMPITNPTNRVINWRLLFPLLGHLLHLPRWAFLALPSLGCLLVLGYVALLVRREGGTRWTAITATALTGTTSWFFVSTGWLAYFDSWYVLGLLVATFSRSHDRRGRRLPALAVGRREIRPDACRSSFSFAAFAQARSRAASANDSAPTDCSFSRSWRLIAV